MGSSASRLLSCVRPSTTTTSSSSAAAPPPLDETLGHSFCYLRSSSLDAPAVSDTTAFFSISGASVSANSSAPLPIHIHPADFSFLPTSHFHSSSSFSALPLQPATSASNATSAPLDRGFFLSGPIERGALSGPLDPVQFSGPLVSDKLKPKSLSRRFRRRKPSSFSLKRSASEKNHRPWVVPIPHGAGAGTGMTAGTGMEGVQWAHVKAGEDRVHVVVSEQHRWLFVGIYDGFNGPDAPDFLVSHLYQSLHAYLRGLFWEEGEDGEKGGVTRDEMRCEKIGRQLWQFLEEDECGLEFSGTGRFAFSLSKIRSRRKTSKFKGEILMPAPLKEVSSARILGPVTNHSTVLNALAQSLESTEKQYLEMTENLMDSNPELALIGSCLLVALIRDDDVYVMNVGDSRAIIGQYASNIGNEEDLEMERTQRDEVGLVALQLSTDHSTSIEEEVLRIKTEHPDDNKCIVNDRVKGRLKVTRAFGAGYLKQAKWNSGLLEMFRNDFIGAAPYITCTPSLCHYKLGPADQFLVLSSDGLYQYLTNEEVVLHVENFMVRFPDGDPAQSLIEELLFRAAKKAGLDFYELLDIPHGDRRKYHDDVTVIVISLEGRIWKSSGRCM
ncbi:Protein phosphatase 2C family protein [Rhynchospora pubera]|uniref:protein-serine/threonine phosphatase n=1 Tax=Rhynchospora pubera TaxID=906938 RepID=A0AAV8BTM5_9POAL|nr:Protein phosphatase 2C family protein [Rhynchospora pubera]